MSVLNLLTIAARNELLRVAIQVDAPKSRGRPRALSTIESLDRIMYVCRSGCQWSQLPTDKCSYKTIHRRFINWSKSRLFESAFRNLATAYVAANNNALIVDTSFVKNVYGSQVTGRNHTDRGRNATKVSLLCDMRGVPLEVQYHMPNKHDGTTLRHLLDNASQHLNKSLASHRELYADKAYDSITCRSTCQRHGLIALIPHRGSRDNLGARRYIVETVFARLDKFRRVILRYDAKMHSFRSFHSLACCSLIR